MSTLDHVFAALADPTRRTVVQRLVADGPTSATNLARDLPVTRQAVVKHLQMLAEAGLVSPERDGRSVRYALHTEPLVDAVAWIAATGVQWDTRLDRLAKHVARRSAPAR